MNASTTPLCLRRAQHHDLGALMDLYRQTGMQGPHEMPMAAAHSLLDRLTSHPDYRLIVATDSARVVGTYTLLIMHNMSHGGSPSGVIESVAVLPEWQQRGVGRQMMAHAMAYCQSRGCYKVALSSNLRRADAHALYESLGFERHGVSFQIQFD